MRFARTITLVLCAGVLLPTTGCRSDGSLDPNWGAAGGAVVGGLLAYKLSDGSKGTTVLGAAAGALAGYAISGGFGDSASEEEKAKPEFQEAKKRHEAAEREQAEQMDRAPQERDYTKVHKKYDAALALSEQPETYNGKGLAYADAGELDKAEEMFRAALRVDPNYAPAKANLQSMGRSA